VPRDREAEARELMESMLVDAGAIAADEPSDS